MNLDNNITDNNAVNIVDTMNNTTFNNTLCVKSKNNVLYLTSDKSTQKCVFNLNEKIEKCFVPERCYENNESSPLLSSTCYFPDNQTTSKYMEENNYKLNVCKDFVNEIFAPSLSILVGGVTVFSFLLIVICVIFFSCKKLFFNDNDDINSVNISDSNSRIESEDMSQFDNMSRIQDNIPDIYEENESVL